MIYKASEWEDAIGEWHVANTSDLAHDSAAWWIPARILNISLVDYILLLKNEYNATIKAWFPESNNNKSLLLFSWKKYSDAHRFLLYINKVARNRNWTM